MRDRFKKFAAEQHNDGFCAYKWSDRIVIRRKQTFAVFGDIAYDVSKMKFDGPGTGKICVPVHGQFLAQFPDEGATGIMGCYILHHKNQNTFVGPSFVPCGWLHTEELNLTNKEIQNNIIENIAQGKNVFSNKPAGWA
jgi:hypothetical protein